MLKHDDELYRLNEWFNGIFATTQQKKFNSTQDKNSCREENLSARKFRELFAMWLVSGHEKNEGEECRIMNPRIIIMKQIILRGKKREKETEKRKLRLLVEFSFFPSSLSRPKCWIMLNKFFKVMLINLYLLTSSSRGWHWKWNWIWSLRKTVCRLVVPEKIDFNENEWKIFKKFSLFFWCFSSKIKYEINLRNFVKMSNKANKINFAKLLYKIFEDCSVSWCDVFKNSRPIFFCKFS